MIKAGYQQFQRAYELLLDDILITDLDISFSAVRTLETEPNTLDLEVLNLNESNRKKLEKKKNFICQLKAGYKGHIGTLFLGEVREIYSEKTGPDWITTISTGDGEKEIQESRINESFAPGTDIKTVMTAMQKQLKVEQGNLIQSLLQGKILKTNSRNFVNGITLSGPVHKEMDRVCKSAGLEWSIQEGKLQILQAAKALQTEAVVLTSDTGLIGSPTVSSDGTLKARMLINSDVVPGKQLVVQSRLVKGRFRADKCNYTGDLAGNDWYIDIEGKELKLI